MPIELYTPRWQNQVTELAADVFGENYFSRPSEIAMASESVMLVESDDNDGLIGFAEGRLLPKDGLGSYLEGRAVAITPDIAEADEKGALGVINAVAVAPEHRRRGVGRRLITMLHDRLVGRGADKLIIMFKRGAGVAPVDSLMHHLGFESWARLPSYWRE